MFSLVQRKSSRSAETRHIFSSRDYNSIMIWIEFLISVEDWDKAIDDGQDYEIVEV
jgi:hypothetical protein